MLEFKPLNRQAIPHALKKAERYRLLNEPAQAESICHDILAVDPENQSALVTLLLALTDQFDSGPAECFTQSQALVDKLHGEYDRLYYHGLIWERRGDALAAHSAPGTRAIAYECIEKAMDYFQRAEPLRPPGNDDALLRWNACLRLCQRYQLSPEPEEQYQPILGDDYTTER